MNRPELIVFELRSGYTSRPLTSPVMRSTARSSRSR